MKMFIDVPDPIGVMLQFRAGVANQTVSEYLTDDYQMLLKEMSEVIDQELALMADLDDREHIWIWCTFGHQTEAVTKGDKIRRAAKRLLLDMDKLDADPEFMDPLRYYLKKLCDADYRVVLSN